MRVHHGPPTALPSPLDSLLETAPRSTTTCPRVKVDYPTTRICTYLMLLHDLNNSVRFGVYPALHKRYLIPRARGHVLLFMIWTAFTYRYIHSFGGLL